MPKLTIECTPKQLSIFQRIGEQMRASPAEVMLAAACGFVDTERKNQAEEYSGLLYLHVAHRQAPPAPKMFQFITEAGHGS